MQKQFLILIAVITILISCHKNSSTPTAENLEGTWKYIGYSGGFIAVEFAPANTETYLQFHGTNYLKNSNGVQNCGSFSFTKDANTNYIGLITYDTSGPYNINNNKYDASLLHDTLRLTEHLIDDGFSFYYIPSSKQFNQCATAQP